MIDDARGKLQFLLGSSYARLRPIHRRWWDRSPFYRWVVPKIGFAIVLLAQCLLLFRPLQLWRLWSGLYIDRRPRSPPAGTRHLVMLVISDLRIDPRVQRSARTLAAAGYRVTVVAPDLDPTMIDDARLDWGPNIAFDLLPVRAAAPSARFPWLANDTMLTAAARHDAFAYHCHDLATALIGRLAANRNRARWICDFHEWYSENVTWDERHKRYIPHPRSKSAIFAWAERFCVRRADATITVCNSIASGLQTAAGGRARPVAVVRNLPSSHLRPTRAYASIKQELGIDQTCFVVLYQGGTGPSRLLEPVIQALAYDRDFVLVIRGPGLDLYGAAYRSLATQIGASDRLILLPPVPAPDVIAAAQGADCGLWSLPNLCKNFSYALPNKVFEYLYAGIPIVAADYPEVRHLVADGQVGLLFDPYDPRSIAAAVGRLRGEPGLTDKMRALIPTLLAELDGDREWGKLLAVYQRLEPCLG